MVHLNIRNDTTNNSSTRDIRACITIYGKVACTFTQSRVREYTCRVVTALDCNITTNGNVFYYRIVRICDCRCNDLTVAVNGYIFNYKVSDSVVCSNTEEAKICFAVCRSVIRNLKIHNLVILTIEVTIEGIIKRTDRRPVCNGAQIDICRKSNIYACCIVLRFACVYAVAEEDKVIYVSDKVRICFRTLTQQASFNTIPAICIKIENQTFRKECIVRAVYSCCGKRTARDCTCQLRSVGATNLRVEVTARYCKRNVVSAIAYEYGRTVAAVRLERTAVNR